MISKILFIGDSLTEYFNWQERFPEYKVANLGISGETVEGLLGRIDMIISSHAEPDFIFIMTGINNIAMGDFAIIESYREILKRLIASFKNSKIVVQSILPVNLTWLSNEAIGLINEKLKALVKEFNIGYLDLYSLFIKEGDINKEYFLDDGVHLSDKGYDEWVNAVRSFIIKYN